MGSTSSTPNEEYHKEEVKENQEFLIVIQFLE